jgi:ArsR family transcriptional regulator
MEQLLQGLRAAAEHTRLRILGLCAHAELTVSELVEILGQSQPRVSRHLKLLMEAGLLERHQEGNWAYFRIAESRPAGELAHLVVDLMPPGDQIHALDLQRLQALKEAYAVKAAAFFKRNAVDWDRIRALHIDQARVDEVLLGLFEHDEVQDILDVGTGTGHVLELLGARVESGTGVDLSRDMLNVARANLFQAGLRNCHVRQADMLQLPFTADRFDAVVAHMVLHYAERPAVAIAEATRVLRPGGRLVVVDFAPHERRELREEHAHRWLGFSDDKIHSYFAEAGLVGQAPRHLDGGEITVAVWQGVRPANDAVQSEDHAQTG